MRPMLVQLAYSILQATGILAQEWSWVAFTPCSGFWYFDVTMSKRRFCILSLAGLELLVAFLPGESAQGLQSVQRMSLGDETRVLRTSFEPLDIVMRQVINILAFCLYAPITIIYAYMHQFLSVLQLQLVYHFSTKGVPPNTTGCKTPKSSAQSSIL